MIFKRTSNFLLNKFLKSEFISINLFSSNQGNEKPSPLKRNYKDVSKLLYESSPLADNQEEESVFATTSYPNGTVFSSFSQGRHSLRPKCDPKDTSIIMFPGQGSQFVGMGKHLLRYPVAREMYETASEILQYDLLKVCVQGPSEKLNQTKYCQPAVVVTSLAAIESLKEEKPEAINNCIATAGFSVGEISALIFAGSFSFESGIKLVRARGEAMQLCSEMTPGGMMTVLLGADSKLSDAIRDAKNHCLSLGIEKPECGVANYLYPSAKVLGGHIEALQFITQHSADYKIRRIFKLPVSGAFHTRLMEPAAGAVEAAIKKALVKDPIISVHRNHDGKRYRDGGHITRTLPHQVFLPVKWEQTMHVLYERPADQDFPNTYEVGPGKSLTTILKKVNAKAAESAHNIDA